MVQIKGLVAERGVTWNVERELRGRPAGALSCSWVIDDGADDLAGRNLCIDGADEPDELLMPGALPAAADNRAVQDTWRRPIRCFASSGCSTDRSMPKAHQDRKW
jgi:hypothetical protein